ncbi:Uncharacterised protein [Mycobacterium tuberculosis]|nr:Uncharacterised protein [Mycobacterium tuberculosis]
MSPPLIGEMCAEAVAAEYTVRAATSATAPATVMPPTCAPIDTAYAGMP